MSPRGLIAAVCLAATAAAAPKEKTRPGPAAHYVIRTSDLNATLSFTSAVLGLRVLRHEENPEACPITCNGAYAVPWSKTMVGTAPEHEAYALEVTYNYGVEGYARGKGLDFLTIYVDDVAAATTAAADLGYAADAAKNAIVGPDGYAYRLAARPAGRTEPFASVHFKVPDPTSTAAWYIETLGMKQIASSADARTVAFPADVKDGGVSFTFVRSGSPSLKVEQFDGRNAFSLPAKLVRRVYDDLSNRAPERIVHELQEINEETGLGVLLIAIVSDINGLELCLVSSEAFEPAISGAANFVGPDYEQRTQLALDYADKVAAAKADAPSVFGWAEAPEL